MPAELETTKVGRNFTVKRYFKKQDARSVIEFTPGENWKIELNTSVAATELDPKEALEYIFLFSDWAKANENGIINAFSQDLLGEIQVEENKFGGKTFYAVEKPKSVWFEALNDSIIQMESEAEMTLLLHISKSGRVKAGRSIYAGRPDITIDKKHFSYLYKIYYKEILEKNSLDEDEAENFIEIYINPSSNNWIELVDCSKEVAIGCQSVKIAPDNSLLLWKNYKFNIFSILKESNWKQISEEDFETIANNLEKIQTALSEENLVFHVLDGKIQITKGEEGPF
jgi:hypothetical protein